MAGASGFEDLYLRERAGLIRAVWAMSGDRDVAMDVVDEAFSRALERWDRVSTMEAPGGWVRTTAVNLVRRSMRRRSLEDRVRRRRRAPMSPAPSEPSPELWAAVAALPQRQREVIALRYIADLTVPEIAKSLRISQGAASASLSKARRNLAQCTGLSLEVTNL